MTMSGISASRACSRSVVPSRRDCALACGSAICCRRSWLVPSRSAPPLFLSWLIWKPSTDRQRRDSLASPCPAGRGGVDDRRDALGQARTNTRMGSRTEPSRRFRRRNSSDDVTSLPPATMSVSRVGFASEASTGRRTASLRGCPVICSVAATMRGSCSPWRSRMVSSACAGRQAVTGGEPLFPPAQVGSQAIENVLLVAHAENWQKPFRHDGLVTEESLGDLAQGCQCIGHSSACVNAVGGRRGGRKGGARRGTGLSVVWRGAQGARRGDGPRTGRCGWGRGGARRPRPAQQKPVMGETLADLDGEAEHPLAHGDAGQDVIGQARGGVGHPAPQATG